MPRNRNRRAPKVRSILVSRRDRVEWLLFKLEKHLNLHGYVLRHTPNGIKILPMQERTDLGSHSGWIYRPARPPDESG